MIHAYIRETRLMDTIETLAQSRRAHTVFAQ